MVILYKDPKGEKIFDRGQSQGTLNITTAGDDKIELSDLQKHCLDLENRLGKYEVSFYGIWYNVRVNNPLSDTINISG